MQPSCTGGAPCNSSTSLAPGVSVSGLVGPTQSLLRILCSPHEPFSLSANSTFRHLPTHFRLQSVESQMPHSANQQRSRATCSSIQLKKQAQIYLKIDATSRSGSVGQAAPPTKKGWVVSGPLIRTRVPTWNCTHPFPLEDAAWPAKLLQHFVSTFGINQHLQLFVSTHIYLRIKLEGNSWLNVSYYHDFGEEVLKFIRICKKNCGIHQPSLWSLCTTPSLVFCANTRNQS